MHDVLFYVVTSVVIGGGCLYALWYANKHGKREENK